MSDAPVTLPSCERSLRNNDLLPVMTALHAFQTIMAPMGMVSMVRFAFQLFRSSKVQGTEHETHQNSLFSKLKPSTTRLVAHSNMEILYLNHLVAAVLFSFFSFLSHGAFFGSLIISPFCDFRFPTWVCVIINTPMHICTHAVALSLFFLCLERTFSTMFFRSYATVGSRAPKVMVAIQYALCCLIFYYQVYTTDLRTQMSICSLINSANQQRTTHITIFVLELTSLIVFGVLSCYNKRMLRRTIGMCLKERYQLDENARSLRTILPTIAMHTACFFVPNALALLLYLILSPAKALVVVIDLVLNWLSYYGLLLPIVIGRISRSAHNVKVQVMAKNKATGTVMQNSHFSELRQTWK